MMKKDEWQKGIDAWEKIKKQAEIDIELAEVVINALQQKINSLVEGNDEVNENGE